MEWSDNISISGTSPAEYFPEYAEWWSSDELDYMMHRHALPDGWEDMAYREFLTNRRKRIALVIPDGFMKLREQ